MFSFFRRGFFEFLFEAYSQYPMLFYALLFHFYFFLNALASIYERFKCLKSGLTLSELQNPLKFPFLLAG